MGDFQDLKELRSALLAVVDRILDELSKPRFGEEPPSSNFAYAAHAAINDSIALASITCEEIIEFGRDLERLESEMASATPPDRAAIVEKIEQMHGRIFKRTLELKHMLVRTRGFSLGG